MTTTRRRVALFVLGFALALSQSPLGARDAKTDHFFIVGYVTNPGQYELEDGTTVGGAIDRAGGFSAGRHVTGVEIIRLVNGQKSTIDVRLGDHVRPDDTIRVK